MRLPLAIILSATLAGCTTAKPWESARVTCLDYANACARAAWEEGKLSGVVHCTPQGANARHAVTRIWIGERWEYYDLTTHKRLQWYDLGVVHRETIGPSRGAYDLLEDIGTEGKHWSDLPYTVTTLDLVTKGDK